MCNLNSVVHYALPVHVLSLVKCSTSTVELSFRSALEPFAAVAVDWRSAPVFHVQIWCVYLVKTLSHTNENTSNYCIAIVPIVLSKFVRQYLSVVAFTFVHTDSWFLQIWRKRRNELSIYRKSNSMDQKNLIKRIWWLWKVCSICFWNGTNHIRVLFS